MTSCCRDNLWCKHNDSFYHSLVVKDLDNQNTCHLKHKKDIQQFLHTIFATLSWDSPRSLLLWRPRTYDYIRTQNPMSTKEPVHYKGETGPKILWKPRTLQDLWRPRSQDSIRDDTGHYEEPKTRILKRGSY